MPTMDGTGPMGQGLMTGRGQGNCCSGKRKFCCGCRLGAGLRRMFSSSKNQLESLEDREKMLVEELEAIKAEKEALSEQK